jgi:acyl-CoA reductase-like NAD-dependent aldehyde dehydrogenase
VVNPATEEVLGGAPASGDQDVDTAVGAARRAFDSGPWGRATPEERADAMDRLAAALERRGDDLARLVSQEMGMPLGLSRFNNVDGPVSTLRYYAGLARGFESEETRTAVNYPGRTVLRREPIGVVGMIAPWNYPLQLAMTKLAPALAAGCTAVPPAGRSTADPGAAPRRRSGPTRRACRRACSTWSPAPAPPVSCWYAIRRWTRSRSPAPP